MYMDLPRVVDIHCGKYVVLNLFYNLHGQKQSARV